MASYCLLCIDGSVYDEAGQGIGESGLDGVLVLGVIGCFAADTSLFQLQGTAVVQVFIACVFHCLIKRNWCVAARVFLSRGIGLCVFF